MTARPSPDSPGPTPESEPDQPSSDRRWPSILLGTVCLLLGIVLLWNPFTSLAVLVVAAAASFVILGLGEMATVSRRSGAATRGLAVAVGAVWLLAAVAVLAWPAMTIAALALVAGIALILDGLAHLVRAARGGTGTDRATNAILGVSGLVFGVLALLWPDITVFVVALLVGIRLAVFGFVRLWNVFTGGFSLRRPHGKLRLAGAVTALVVALALTAVSVFLQVSSPRPDGFYEAADAVIDAPGTLLRAERLTDDQATDRGIPSGAHAWRILYSTTRDEDRPAVASGLVLAPKSAAPTPRPVIAWAHGTTGVVPGCAPSVLDDPFGAGATPAVDQVVDEGWVMVATDYVGLGTEGPHPYLIGQGEARSVLDAVRAAHQMNDLDLSDDTVVWGHSQGGHAALWTGMLAPTYAPDAHVRAIAAMSPASDLIGLARGFDTAPGGSVFGSYIAESYAANYPDVHLGDIIRPAARLPVQEMAARCLAEPSVFVSALESLLLSAPIFAGDPTTGPLGRRLAENIPDKAPEVPLLLTQGGSDTLILPDVQKNYTHRLCGTGADLDYREYPGYGHVDVVTDPDSPLIGDLMEWTRNRFAGQEPTGTCPR